MTHAQEKKWIPILSEESSCWTKQRLKNSYYIYIQATKSNFQGIKEHYDNND